MASYGDYRKIEPLNAEFVGVEEKVKDAMKEMMAFVRERGVVPQSMKIIVKNSPEYSTVAWRLDE